MDKAFIFDLDGTLLDTEILTQEALRAVSIKYGERNDVENFFPATCGTTLKDAKSLYKDFFGKDYPFESRRNEMREWMRDYINNHGAQIKKGAKEILDFLKENGYKIALATSSTRMSAEWNIKKAGFEEYFDAIVCGDDIENSKPHPEIFLKAAKMMGVKPQNCYVAEDSYLGVEAGFRAQMTVFMIPDLKMPREREKELSFKICDNLLEVIKYL